MVHAAQKHCSNEVPHLRDGFYVMSYAAFDLDSALHLTVPVGNEQIDAAIRSVCIRSQAEDVARVMLAQHGRHKVFRLLRRDVLTLLPEARQMDTQLLDGNVGRAGRDFRIDRVI